MKGIASAIGLIASIIGIFAFATGIQSIRNIPSAATSAELSAPPTVSAPIQKLSIESIFGIKTIGYGSGLSRRGNVAGGTEAAQSPDGNRFAIIDRGRLAIVNSNGANLRKYILRGSVNQEPYQREFSELRFVSNSRIHVFIELLVGFGDGENMTFGGFPLRKAGMYELVFDGSNSLVRVSLVR